MTKYPVKADPTWCGNFWNDVGWVTEHEIYRNNKYGQIVRADPSWCLKGIAAVNPFGSMWLSWDSWRELLDRLPANNNAWPNRAYGTEVYWSLHNQMACHIDGVKLANTANQVGIRIQGLTTVYRDSYHLELRTRNYGWIGFLRRGCNDVTPIDERAFNTIKLRLGI